MATRHVVVEMHAQALDLAGEREAEVGVRPGDTCADLKRALARLHPQLARLLESSVLASDREYLADSAPLGDGIRFHLIPPVSGG